MEKVAGELGSIRILVANAGLNGMYGPFVYVPWDELVEVEDITIGTILKGTIQTVAAVLPHMIEQKYGRIITLCGGGVERPLENQVIYSGAKGGVTSFSRCLALELSHRPEDIKVNIYEPGFVKTGLINSGEIVPNWVGQDRSRDNTEIVLKYIGTDINLTTKHVLPYALPSCKANGKLFRDYSIRKMISGGSKLRKAMKQMRQASAPAQAPNT